MFPGHGTQESVNIFDKKGRTFPFVMDLITEAVSHFCNGLLSACQDVFVAALLTQWKVGQGQTAALLFE